MLLRNALLPAFCVPLHACRRLTGRLAQPRRRERGLGRCTRGPSSALGRPCSPPRRLQHRHVFFFSEK
jgi:hypothetical protein